MRLWVNKYRPDEFSGFVGQPKALRDIRELLKGWKQGNAVLIYGPPGVGKTLSVELLAREMNHVLLQMNASDTRNKSGIEEFLSDTTRSKALFHEGKMILIDEVDGVSSRDRGAVTSIVKIIKESLFPVFLTANDPWKPKLMPLRNHCKMIRFNRIHSASIEKRLKEICSVEGVMAEDGVLKNLARWSQGDLRSAISDLQIAAYGSDTLTNDDLQTLG